MSWGASVVIWTTTPWTLPGNRAISFSPKIAYGLYRITDAPADNWAKTGDALILADKLAADVFKQARVDGLRKGAGRCPHRFSAGIVCAHPLNSMGGYDFDVPLLPGDHVTDDAGTGFVHTAPGHGREDFEIWTANARALEARGINPAIPYTVDENGAFTAHAPGFEGKRVINDKGEKGDANEAVIKALAAAGNIIARGRLKHQYPHSWRSKKPVIFRNTPQWFIAMDKPIKGLDGTLRGIALREIKETRWVPAAGENRITGMIESRPDWVISRQRAWGVPIAVFVRENADGSAEILQDEAVNKRIADAFEQEGADAWYKAGARERFLGSRANEDWKKVDDICDVWFDSGSTHAFVLEDPKHFPSLAGIRRKHDGGPDTVMYLEGSDQHRGWFHSSLLESCGTRGRAPFDVVLTHGFVLDEQGRKMSKSLGNVIAPQDVIEEFRRRHPADVGVRLRLRRRSAHRPGNPEDHDRDLSQAAQHHPLDARQPRAFPRRGPHRAGEDAGAGAADAASARRARRARPQGLRRLRLQAHLRGAQPFHDHRPLGVLFRHPQGRALLRSDLVADAQGRAHRDRPAVPLHRDLARADAVLHRRGGLVRAHAIGRRLGASRAVPRGAGVLARRQARGEMAQGPRSCAASSPARWRSSAPASASAPRSKPIRSCTSPIRSCSRRWSTSTSPRSASPRRRRWSTTRARPTRSGSPDVPGVAVVVNLAEGRKCARSWKISARPSAAIRNIPTSRRATRRRSANGKPCARRRSERLMAARSRMFWGPLTRFGLVTAAIACVLDQASKLWLLKVFDLADKGVVKLAPFVDLVLTWNTGISYGWFQQEGPFGQGALLALKVVAVALLWIWLAKAPRGCRRSRSEAGQAWSRLSAVSLGLIIGGAIGNGIDRLAYGAVADFVLLHAETATWRFNWYVFNLADVAIVAGVAGLLYESFWGTAPQKRPDPGCYWGRKPQTAVSSMVRCHGCRHDELQVQPQIQPGCPCRHDRHGGGDRLRRIVRPGRG